MPGCDTVIEETFQDMPDIPKLDVADVATALPDLQNIAVVDRGGQKLVFRATYNGQPYAVKFALLPSDVDNEDLEHTEITQRASREVEIMRDCTSPFMVKLGPIGLNFTTVADQQLLYFSEEFIEGSSVKALLRDGPLSLDRVVRLGTQISNAIKELWALGKIHRDIKPANIMQRTNGAFVLLDAGLAFDVVGDSLSKGFIVGTMPYFSPEQFDYDNRRRVLDFRSDIFSLGVTLYEAITGQHPFWTRGDNSASVFRKITAITPPPPSAIRPEVPKELDRLILRMMAKSPHLRYRKCDDLISALNGFG
jgi:serine/threonine-protein kinase